MTKIGIFDSGIGGLSILREIHKLDRKLDIYYIADSINNPYGLKGDAFVQERSHELVEKFQSLNIRHVVVACNTATASAIDSLRLSFPEITFIGVEPYINVINQRPDLKNKRGAVLATPLTGKSKRFLDLKNKYDPESLLDIVLPDKLASIIEDNFFQNNDIEIELRESLNDAVSKYDFCILGCTHYPLISKALSKILGAQMISPCQSVARRVDSLIEHTDITKSEVFKFLKTDEGEGWRDLKYKVIFKNS